TVSPASAVMRTIASRGSGGATVSANAAASSAKPPIQTSGPSAVPRAKNNAANERAPAAPATAAPPAAGRSSRARTGADASIAKPPPDGRSQPVYTGQTARTPPSETLPKGVAADASLACPPSEHGR